MRALHSGNHSPPSVCWLGLLFAPKRVAGEKRAVAGLSSNEHIAATVAFDYLNLERGESNDQIRHEEPLQSTHGAAATQHASLRARTPNARHGSEQFKDSSAATTRRQHSHAHTTTHYAHNTPISTLHHTATLILHTTLSYPTSASLRTRSSLDSLSRSVPSSLLTSFSIYHSQKLRQIRASPRASTSHRFSWC